MRDGSVGREGVNKGREERPSLFVISRLRDINDPSGECVDLKYDER